MYNSDMTSKHRTRENIKNKFLELYKNRTLKKIKVNDIISACNISRGTFYFYYTDMYALYRECEKDAIDLLEMRLSDVNLSTVTRDYNKHIKVYSSFLKTYVENIDMYKSFISGSEEASFRQAWLESNKRNYGKIMEFSNTTLQSKCDNLILFFAGGHVALLSNWILTGCRESTEDIACIISQVLFQGIFSETRKKTH